MNVSSIDHESAKMAYNRINRLDQVNDVWNVYLNTKVPHKKKMSSVKQ